MPGSAAAPKIGHLRSPPAKSASQYSTRLPCRCSPSRTVKRRKERSPGFIKYSAECVATQRFCASSVVAPITGCSRIPSAATWIVFAAPQGLGPPKLEPEPPRSKEPPHAAASSTAASAFLNPTFSRTPSRPRLHEAPSSLRGPGQLAEPTVRKSTRRACREWSACSQVSECRGETRFRREEAPFPPPHPSATPSLVDGHRTSLRRQGPEGRADPDPARRPRGHPSGPPRRGLRSRQHDPGEQGPPGAHHARVRPPAR